KSCQLSSPPPVRNVSATADAMPEMNNAHRTVAMMPHGLWGTAWRLMSRMESALQLARWRQCSPEDRGDRRREGIAPPSNAADKGADRRVPHDEASMAQTRLSAQQPIVAVRRPQFKSPPQAPPPRHASGSTAAYTPN